MPPHDSLQRYLFLSALGHGALFLSLLILLPRLQLPRVADPLSVVMIELPKGTSETIGLGIPDTPKAPEIPIAPEPVKPPPTPTAPPMKEPAIVKTPTPAPIPKPVPPRPALTPAEEKMRRALAQMDADLKKRNQAVPAPPAQNAAPSEGWKEGTGTTPIKTIPPGAELMRYQAAVRARILREWIMPPGIKELPPNMRPSAKIMVRISASGHITSTGWAKASGNASFDASVMRAAQRANPLPIPPESVRSEAVQKGFTVTFVVR
ncbi:MAG: cell envelope integrity protein TolA [Deltaproteobacteria bacterium]|nr:cell envelope integrity protein TolA [Deltaproteobacteria bacterium]